MMKKKLIFNVFQALVSKGLRDIISLNTIKQGCQINVQIKTA